MAKIPDTNTDPRSFTELASYFQYFINAFLQFAASIHAATTPNELFTKDSKMSCRLNNLRNVLCKPPVFAYFNFPEPLITSIDGVLCSGRNFCLKKWKLESCIWASRLIRQWIALKIWALSCHKTVWKFYLLSKSSIPTSFISGVSFVDRSPSFNLDFSKRDCWPSARTMAWSHGRK